MTHILCWERKKLFQLLHCYFNSDWWLSKSMSKRNLVDFRFIQASGWHACCASWLTPLLQEVRASIGSVSWQNTSITEVYNRAGMSWQGNQTQPGWKYSRGEHNSHGNKRTELYSVSFWESCPGSSPSQQTWELLVQGFPWSHCYNNTRICPTGFVTPQHTKTHCKRLQAGLADTQTHLP